MARWFVMVSLLVLSGCASTGPLVTNISYDASGSLMIEKCRIHSNYFLGTIDLRDCNHHSLGASK